MVNYYAGEVQDAAEEHVKSFLRGKISKGYIAGGTVFFDANRERQRSIFST